MDLTRPWGPWGRATLGFVGAATLLWAPLLRPDRGLPLSDLRTYFPSLYAAHPWTWDPMVQGGASLAANPQSGLWYPPAWLLRDGLQEGLPFFLIVHTAVAALGAWAWARRRGIGDLAAVLAGVAWGAAGATVSLALTPDKLPGQAAAPWVLLGVELLAFPRARFDRAMGLPLTAGALLTCWFGGALEWALASATMAVIWASFAAPGGGPAGPTPSANGRSRRIALVLLALAAGTAAAGPSLVPFAVLLPHTVRAHGLRAGAAADRAFTPRDLLAAVAPNVFWGGEDRLYRLPPDGTTRRRWLRSPYLGVSLLPLAGLGLLGRRSATGGRGAALALAVGFGLLSLGEQGPLWGIFHRLPVMDSLRYPEKAWCLVSLPFAWLAARGASELLRGASFWPLVGIAAASLLAPSAAPLLHHLPAPSGARLAAALSALTAVSPALLVLITASLLGALGHLARPRAVLGFAVAAALDLGLATWGAFLPVGLAHERIPPPVAAAIHADAGRSDPSRRGGAPPRLWDDTGHRQRGLPPGLDPRAARAAERDLLMPNLGVEHGIAYVDGMREPRMARQAIASGPLEDLDAARRRARLRRLGTDYWLLWDQQEALDLARTLGLRPVPAAPGTALPVGLLAEPDPPPRLRALRRLHRAGDLDGAEALFDSLPDDEAVVLPGDPGADVLLDADTYPPAQVGDVRTPAPGRWSAHVEAPGGTVLLLQEGWAPGWSVRLDGGRWVEAGRADLHLVAARIPAGNHHVELRYRTRGLAAGLWLGLVAVLGLAAGAWRLRRLDRDLSRRIETSG